MKNIFNILFVALFVAFLTSCESTPKEKPVIYTIGDSTVKCGQGDGGGGLWGWGDPIQFFFDTTKVEVVNVARGGTSSRTFRTLGLWEPNLEKLKKGDFVFIQFGHNDGGALNDSTRARGTFKGIGEEEETIENILTGKTETVYSYGAYLTMYINEIKEKGATPILVTPIPRNRWNDEGKIPYNDESYGGWVKQVAEREGVVFIDLNHKLVDAMNELGEENVTDVLFWKRDHTHTSAKGAALSASLVVEGIKENPELGLTKYLLNEYPIQAMESFFEKAKEKE